MDRILRLQEQIETHIFYTHFHWDHIQGLPFFQPIYFKSSKINIYSPEPSKTVFENLDFLFDGSYSPFAGIGSMPSQIAMNELTPTSSVCGLTISFHPLDHQQTKTYAFRITDSDGHSMAIVTDHEARPSMLNDSLVEFLTGVDLLIHDAQFTDLEYQKKSGWGHSTPSQALANATRARVGQCLLTHHDPSRSDAELQTLQKQLRKDPRYKNLAFHFAREEVVYPVATLKGQSDQSA